MQPRGSCASALYCLGTIHLGLTYETLQLPETNEAIFQLGTELVARILGADIVRGKIVKG